MYLLKRISLFMDNFCFFNEECLEILGKDLIILINNFRYKDNFLFRFGRLRIKLFEIFF